MTLRISFLITCIVVLFSCGNEKPKTTDPVAEEVVEKKDSVQNESPLVREGADFISPLGKKLKLTDPPKAYQEKFNEAVASYKKDPNDLENMIWLGRRTAYLGHYQTAINTYSKALLKFPDEPRLYRHRGHRYISIREYDKAIADLEKAAELINGKKNKVEQDGLPNDKNIPISTLHGNIYYHLGLAYYLKHNFEKAFQAYEKGRSIGKNDDNIVSTTHWLYMIQKRMGNDELAERQLGPIHDKMNIIENHSYYDLCKFYKGLIPRDSLLNQDGTPSGDAVKYGLANWDFYNGDGEAAKQGFENILEGKSWSSFGYIAAEQDYLKHFSEK